MILLIRRYLHEEFEDVPVVSAKKKRPNETSTPVVKLKKVCVERVATVFPTQTTAFITQICILFFS